MGAMLLIDGVDDGVEGAVAVAVAGVDEVDLRAFGDGAGVLEVEVGLGFVAGGDGLEVPELGTRMTMGVLAAMPTAFWKFVMSERLMADWPMTAMDWLEPV